MVPSTSITFVSKASLASGAVAKYGLRKRVEAVKDCRTVGKKDMKFNDVMPKMKVDPERYVSLHSSPCTQANLDRLSKLMECSAQPNRQRLYH
jgi:urease alpha subunit